jgi:hypothetical protein
MTAITTTGASHDFFDLQRAAARTLLAVALALTALGLLLGFIDVGLTILALIAVLGWTQLVGI